MNNPLNVKPTPVRLRVDYPLVLCAGAISGMNKNGAIFRVTGQIEFEQFASQWASPTDDNLRAMSRNPLDFAWARSALIATVFGRPANLSASAKATSALSACIGNSCS